MILALKSSTFGNVAAFHVMDLNYSKEDTKYKTHSFLPPFELKRSEVNDNYPSQKDVINVGPIHLSSGLTKDDFVFKILVRMTDDDFITHNSTQSLLLECIYPASSSNVTVLQEVIVVRKIWQSYAHIEMSGSVLNGNSSSAGFCPGSTVQIELRIKHSDKSSGECHYSLLRILKAPNVIYDEAVNSYESNYPLNNMTVIVDSTTNLLKFRFDMIDLSTDISLRFNLSVKEDKIGLYSNGSAKLVLLPHMICHIKTLKESYGASSYSIIDFNFSYCNTPLRQIPMNQTCQVNSNSIYPNTSPLDITNAKGWKSNVKHHGLTEHRLDFDFLLGMSLTGFYFESDSNYLVPQKMKFHFSFIKNGYHSQISEIKVEPNQFIQFPQAMNGRYVRITIKEVSEPSQLDQKPIFIKNLKWTGTKILSKETYTCAPPSPDTFIRSYIIDTKNKILYVCDTDPDLDRPICYSRHHETENIKKLPLYVHGIVGYKSPGRVFFSGPDGKAHLSSTNGEIIETHPALDASQISVLESPIHLPGYEPLEWPSNIPSVEIDGVPYKATFEGILIGDDLKIKWK
ncbi:uncharacterized protein [Lepeophtheirus salmonis]|uniref:uncharacterized protein n=1 Tax=Lepeophtheirus salmonis TaxID=72036 RepID=UPI003AF391CB